MPTQLRSQSFRHRSRPLIELKHYPLEDISQERRRSTPTVSRRPSIQRFFIKKIIICVKF